MLLRGSVPHDVLHGCCHHVWSLLQAWRHQGYPRSETRSTATVRGMAGFGRHGLDRADAGRLPRDAHGWHGGEHVVHVGRWMPGTCSACGSSPCRHAQPSRRPHRTMRLLRAVFAYAGGGIRCRGRLAALAVLVVRPALNDAAPRAGGAAVECASEGTTVVRRRLIWPLA